MVRVVHTVIVNNLLDLSWSYVEMNPALSISPNYRRVRNRATYFAVFRHWDQLKRAPFRSICRVFSNY